MRDKKVTLACSGLGRNSSTQKVGWDTEFLILGMNRRIVHGVSCMGLNPAGLSRNTVDLRTSVRGESCPERSRRVVRTTCKNALRQAQGER